VFADQALPLIATRLTNRNLFDDVGTQHEYILLMQASFSRLTEKDQAKILGWIEAGPDIEWLREQRQDNGSTPSDEEITHYREAWQRDWLAWIGSENLPKDWQERYRTLVEHYGEPEHPEFLIYREGGWVGPAIPKSADELKGMSVAEIVEFPRHGGLRTTFSASLLRKDWAACCRPSSHKIRDLSQSRLNASKAWTRHTSALSCSASGKALSRPGLSIGSRYSISANGFWRSHARSRAGG